MRYLSVSNWARFQHYKNRDPTWLKLYRALLTDYQWSQLDDASKGHLIGLWLMAAKLGNRIPADPEWLGNQIGATQVVSLDALVAGGWLEWCEPEHASKSLAPCKQPASDVLAGDPKEGANGEQCPGSSNPLALTRAPARTGAPSLEGEREREKEKEREQSPAMPSRAPARAAPSFLFFSDEDRQQVEALARLRAAKREGQP